jgi:hypothetical protein
MAVNPGASRVAKVSQRPAIVNQENRLRHEIEFNAVQMMAIDKLTRSPIRLQM